MLKSIVCPSKETNCPNNIFLWHSMARLTTEVGLACFAWLDFLSCNLLQIDQFASFPQLAALVLIIQIQRQVQVRKYYSTNLKTKTKTRTRTKILQHISKSWPTIPAASNFSMHGMLSNQIKPKKILMWLDNSNKGQSLGNWYKAHRNVTKMKTESRIKSSSITVFMKIVVKVGQA